MYDGRKELSARTCISSRCAEYWYQLYQAMRGNQYGWHRSTHRNLARWLRCAIRNETTSSCRFLLGCCAWCSFVGPWHLVSHVRLFLHGDWCIHSMRRVEENKNWTLFCPSEVPLLTSLFGSKFDQAYERYEALDIPKVVMPAKQLWDTILICQLETSGPSIVYKDSVNR